MRINTSACVARQPKSVMCLSLFRLCFPDFLTKRSAVSACLSPGRGGGRAWQRRAAAGGAQNHAVQGERAQPPGVHPGCPTVTLEHQAFHHLPGHISLHLLHLDLRKKGASSFEIPLFNDFNLLLCWFLTVVSKPKDSSKDTAGDH